jgi:hypothetical protein
MPVVSTRYEPDHRGLHDFLHGPEMTGIVMEAGADVVGHATGQSQHLDGHWHVTPGDLTIGLYSRVISEVSNDSPLAASIEFGTARGRAGQTGIRRQGGWSPAQRILGKAGSLVGEVGEAG